MWKKRSTNLGTLHVLKNSSRLLPIQVVNIIIMGSAKRTLPARLLASDFNGRCNRSIAKDIKFIGGKARHSSGKWVIEIRSWSSVLLITTVRNYIII